MIIKTIKRKLIPLYQYLSTWSSQEILHLAKGKRNAIIFLAPDYGNIGDLAIGLAQISFLKDRLKDYNIISITVSDTYKYLKSIKNNMNKEDLIFLVGGGSFGDLYPKADFGRLFLIKYFRNYKICFFPQTMFFTNTSYGQSRLRATRETFKKHDNLTLVAREKLSYEMMKDNFTNPVILSPDIVLSLMPSTERARQKRGGVIFTLRSDAEKLIGKDQEQSLIDYISEKYSDVQFKDTTVPTTEFDFSKNKQYVDEVLSTYSSSEFVITDRLHGMIFAAITGTPCIVLPNSNHKIKATYDDWLYICNYISLVQDASLDAVQGAIDKYQSKQFKNNYTDVKFDFSQLEMYLQKNS